MADTGGPLGPTDDTVIEPVTGPAGPPPSSASGPEPGTLGSQTLVAGRYRLISPLGSGGMAQVWEATDEVLGRRVAVKLLHPHLATDETFVRRFRQEAIAAARLSHSGIVGVYDTCSDGTHEAIVMELLDARTLRAVLDERGTLDVESVERIGLRLLDALEAAHRAGLVHRDVKPSNILLCVDGRVKIADFGIAKADDHTELTREGSLMGTVSYLAPEQLTGVPTDGRADLYSLGIVLYECLTGRVPFEGETGAAVAMARLHHDPVDPRRYRADVPASLADAIMKALARNPDERYPDAAAFRAALTWLADDTAQHAAVALPEPEPPAPASGTEVGFTRSERRWLLPALFIVLVASALIVAVLLMQRTRDTVDDTTPTVPPGATPARIADVRTFDPFGSGTPGENDDQRFAVVDGDIATAWPTESYDTRTFFGTKTGVGLELVLAEPSRLDSLGVISSTNGWSAEIHLLDDPDAPNPDAEPFAVVTDVREPVELDLGGATASAVLIWITDLGEPNGERHRVEIAEVSVVGTVAED